MLALAFLAALRAEEEEVALKKSLGRRQSSKQPTLFKLTQLLIFQSWFLSALLKSGDCFFVSSVHRLSLLPTLWPGHSGDVRTKLSRAFVITGTDVRLPVIYNCRIREENNKKGSSSEFLLLANACVLGKNCI
jgi:hypothetical protein